MDNYQTALNFFLSNPITEENISIIGMNRKSRTYDKVYYPFYCSLKKVVIDHSDDIFDLFETLKSIKQFTLWKLLLFKNTNTKYIKSNKRIVLNTACEIFQCKTEKEFKAVFFKYLHIFKAKATLADYFDLNRRYFGLTNTLIFQDQKVSFDIFPHYFFKSHIHKLENIVYSSHQNLCLNVSLEEVLGKIKINENIIYKDINKKFNCNITSAEQAEKFIKSERNQRFNTLLEEKFTPEKLITLLDYFKTRDDKKIEELVTDEADIPTIFEYILAISWYWISEKKR